MQVKRQFVDGQVDHLKILHGPEIGGPQKLSPRLIQKGIVEGWLSFGGGKATIKTAPDLPDMELKVIRGPGLYCCFDDEPLTDEKAAREYVLDNFESKSAKGFLLQVLEDASDDDGNPIKRVVREGHVKESPDAENPAGYRQDNFFLCERVS